jgi:hypothetical protein
VLEIQVKKKWWSQEIPRTMVRFWMYFKEKPTVGMALQHKVSKMAPRVSSKLDG